MFERLSKHWYKSKQIWFSIIHGLPILALTVLEYLSITDLSSILGAKSAMAASIYFTLAGIILRAITTQALEHK